MATAPLPFPESRSLRAMVSEFLSEIIDRSDEFDTADLVAQAESHFSGDDDFVAAVFRDVLAQLVPILTRDIVHRRKDLIRTPTGAVSRTKIDLTARERFAKVFEGIGDGSYKTILVMNRRQLLVVNERDQKQVDTLVKWIGARADLAKSLKSEQQVVGDLPSRTLQVIWNRHLRED